MSIRAETAAPTITTGALSLPWIIGASSVGTLIEWYDFYLYGVLAVFFSKHFFSPAHEPDGRLHRQPVRVLDRVSWCGRSAPSCSAISAT